MNRSAEQAGRDRSGRRVAVSLACLLGVALLAAPHTARAGGVALPSRGVHATSMGGAFVAGAEGVNAFWYNPANLDESLVGAEAGLVRLSGAFTPSEGAQAGVRAESNGRLIPNPTLGLVLRLDDRFSVGAALYAPYAGFQRFDEGGSQRYALVESDETTLAYAAVGAAFRVGHFRVGATIQNVLGRVKQRVVISGYSGLFGNAQDPELDILQEVDLRDQFTLTGNLGAAYDLGPVTFGASLQLPYKVAGKASLRVRLPSSVFFDNVTVEGDQAELSVPIPLMVRGGVLVRATSRLKMEAAVNFENWSTQREIVIDAGKSITLRGVPGIGDYQLPPIRLDRRMKNTYSLHLGGDFEVIDGLHLRTGGYYEPSSFGDATYSVAQLDDKKVGLGFGASWDIGAFRLDLAASRVFGWTRVVSTSELRQINPTNPDQAAVVGNGRYETSYWVVGTGLQYKM